MSNSRGLLIGNTSGRGRVNIKAGSKEKLNNPMETTKRLLKYLGDKKIYSNISISVFNSNHFNNNTWNQIKWRHCR